MGFGEDDAFPQGGMNERGVIFDMFSTPPIDIAKLPRKTGFKGNIVDKMMAECETVEQVVSLFDGHSRVLMHHPHTLLECLRLRKAEPVPAKVDPKVFDDYTGVYEVAGTKFTVLREADGLMLEAAAVGRIELTPASAVCAPRTAKCVN